MLLVAAFYGLSDAVIDTGGSAIDNLSDTKENDDGDIQFSSAEPRYNQKNKGVDMQKVVV